MPTGLKGGQQELIPPQTRVAQAWAHLWRGVFRDSRRRLERGELYAHAIRRIR